MAEITLEQVEKLRARCDLGYEEARALLERCNGSVLDALIELERQGRANSPDSGHSSASDPFSARREPFSRPPVPIITGSAWENFWKDAKSILSKLWDILRDLNRYQLHVLRGDRLLCVIPLWVLLILIFVVWITVPLLIIGLMMHCRYELVKEG